MNAEANKEIQLPYWQLLELLADGREHSGQELANVLGVSRTSIWKQLAKLNAIGIEVLSRPGHGYRISGGFDFLSPQKILALLDPFCSKLVADLIILPVVDSTNAFLLQQDANNKIDVCMAEYQTAGRGRRGRNWISPFAKNIYLSLKMTVESGVNALEGLSLATGVAAARALTKLQLSGLELKWPNDILHNGEKLGGILIEVVGDPAGRCHVVVGVGINVASKKSTSMVIDQPWTSLTELAEELSVSLPQRNNIAAAVLNEIIPLLATYEERGFTFYREEWQSMNAHQGQSVDIHMGSVQVNGVVAGVNEIGALLLETKDKGVVAFHGGEISLREVGR